MIILFFIIAGRVKNFLGPINRLQCFIPEINTQIKDSFFMIAFKGKLKLLGQFKALSQSGP